MSCAYLTQYQSSSTLFSCPAHLMTHRFGCEWHGVVLRDGVVLVNMSEPQYTGHEGCVIKQETLPPRTPWCSPRAAFGCPTTGGVCGNGWSVRKHTRRRARGGRGGRGGSWCDGSTSVPLGQYHVPTGVMTITVRGYHLEDITKKNNPNDMIWHKVRLEAFGRVPMQTCP